MGEFRVPYEKAAMRGDEMPDGLDLPDQLCFLGLRMLYAQAKQGIISREVGSREKGRLLHQREIQMQKLKTKENLVTSACFMLQNTEGAANRYAKNRTLENADALYEAIYRVPVTKSMEE